MRMPNIFKAFPTKVLASIALALPCFAGEFLGLSDIAQAEEIEFNRDVRSILSENCFACHGPDHNKREGGLRLDSRDGAVAKSDSGKVAIVAGNPDQSELIARILSDDPDVHMPPARSEKHLTTAQKETLRQWVAQGAKYQSHWAFIPPVRPSLPRVANMTTERANPIDLFIRGRLEREGCSPAKEADKVTLIRRATLDLTGLPPNPEEIDAFLKDESINAYEKVIDRLLNAPQYGERMALNWLDYARYADSNGFQSDGSRDIWAWRDWVIQAYNKNLPFDQFTIEQLAGDLLPNATPDQIIATGFNRNHRLNGEGGRIEAEWFVETVIDRVETTGLTWLGLTFNCCRCHDHKFDPISQKEFYSLYAFFNSNDESGVLAPSGKNGENTPPLLTLSTAETEREIARLESIRSNADTNLKNAESRLPAWIQDWEKSMAVKPSEIESEWRTFDNAIAKSVGGAQLTKLSDGSFLASGPNPANDSYVASGALQGSELTAILIEVFPDSSLPNESLGRGFNGNFILTDVSAQIQAPSLSEPLKLRFSKAQADYEQQGWTAASIVTARAKRKADANIGWAIDGNDVTKRLPRKLVLQTNKAVPIPNDAKIEITIKNGSTYPDHNVGRFRLSTTSIAPDRISLKSASTSADVRLILDKPLEDRTDEQRKILEEHFKKNVPSPYADAVKELESAKKKLQDYRDDLPTTMVMKEGKPRDAFVLVRGQYDQPSDKVTRGVPAVFPPIPETESMDRLGFAKWIVQRNNPLTARVWVNREWERFFGIGLVKTTENFGAQAEYPSHPELLDWLACEFMEPTKNTLDTSKPPTAWDMKSLQKLILLSQTYRQSQRVDLELAKRDPENRLLTRASRIRLTGEVLRDSALAVSKLLVPKIGGPSVRPYMPEGVWDETSKYGNLRNYMHDKGEGLYRRTMYTIWKRTAAPPSLLLFDAPNREACIVKRSRTNTPLQALSLMNEVTFVEAARHFGSRMILEGGSSDRERIQFGFRTAIGRAPTDRESEVLLKGLADDQNRFRSNPDATKLLLKTGDSPSHPELDPATHAAYTLVANILLNLDEFVTRE